MINDISTYLKGNGNHPLFLFAGPCVVYDEESLRITAASLAETSEKLGMPLVLKGSYRKANRSRLDSFTGIGDRKALELLRKVGDEFGLPIITDIHETHEAAMAAEYAEILQIPAFLCRQTDLLAAAARTGRMVNIKKGQFLSPEAMAHAVDKVRQAGNQQVCVTERGTTFGYQDLIVDMRSIPRMQEACQCPVVADITHSLQQPNQSSGVTGGSPQMCAPLARAMTAAGADGIFLETHPEPAKSKSDAANMLALKDVEPLLRSLKAIHEVILQERS